MCRLVIVIWLRPEDLLRWCPTGKTWDSYRRGRVMKIPDLPTRFAEVGRFHSCMIWKMRPPQPN
jgi:hypothetical protein